MSHLLTLLLSFLTIIIPHATSSPVNGTVLVRGNATIQSLNGTFSLGFFTTNGDSNWYLGIWYTSVTPKTYVWVANRETPTKNLQTSSFELTKSGRFAVKATENLTVWETKNKDFSNEAKLKDDGNLVLLTKNGTVSWQSFDYPTDTWLPGMNLTRDKFLTSWRALSDPSPGFYSLRLNPDDYGEFELVYNATASYWTTGNWTGNAFSNVPEMTVPYIYRFDFDHPFYPNASFGFTLSPLDTGFGSDPPLSMFKMEYDGRLHQYTWSPQNENWYKFWSRPESACHVYGLCGSFALCNSMESLTPCECLNGFEPQNEVEWESKDYSSGCRRDSLCDGKNDNDETFEEVGVVDYNGAVIKSFSGSNRGDCESACLNNCDCIGLYYNERSSLCKNLYGSLLNLQKLNDSIIGIGESVLYVRVASVKKERERLNFFGLIGGIVGSVLVLGFVGIVVFVLLWRKGKGVDEDGGFAVLNLKVFSYKELHLATRAFSEKLGHGGFGTVFQGELSDSTLVAVKRLERPGGAEREFRAEVCTIGNIQHVNLVRLRGFCSENSHRLLVYDYMPNGPLSVYLRQEGPNNLSWDLRFRVAVDTARGIAYLHEECRDCIIHCDIKPENILLDSEYNAKVSDFGLAKLIGRDFSRVLVTMRGTWGYVAPEWISGVEITTKADVYSYGMTLLELIGGRRNVEALPSGKEFGGVGGGGGAGEKWFFPPWAAQHIIEGNIGAVVDSRLGSAYDIEEIKRVALVAVWCIQDEEVMRPTMGMVVKMLEGVVEVTVPPAPRLLQALVSGESFCGVRVDSSNGVSTGSGFYGDRMAVVSSVGSESSLGNVSSPVNKNVNA
jgi:hypothetical protein